MAQSHLSEADAVQEFIGFATNPAPMLVAQYERIAREEMQALPFYHATMPIVAECVLFEEQWLGCVLTPWMLSVVVLPGLDTTLSTAAHEALLDPEWLCVKTTFSADKTAIKAALKAGQQIIGAQLISRRSWRIH